MADRRNETTTICGTDLHILKGDVPAVEDGRILGHKGVGTITEVGSAVTGLTIGDRAIDVDRSRVEQAKRFGATDSVVSTGAGWKDQVMALTDSLGVDFAIEAVGIPETFAMVLCIVRPAGHVA
ncbi:MAG: zinc-dependent alcohol dehydrogenase family protein, partial [Arthrobacter sp.]|nr:zinc-dependent alcohol dehydrogenase family protein [Arthrobacter sp.]